MLAWTYNLHSPTHDSRASQGADAQVQGIKGGRHPRRKKLKTQMRYLRCKFCDSKGLPTSARHVQSLSVGNDQLFAACASAPKSFTKERGSKGSFCVDERWCSEEERRRGVTECARTSLVLVRAYKCDACRGSSPVIHIYACRDL